MSKKGAYIAIIIGAIALGIGIPVAMMNNAPNSTSLLNDDERVSPEVFTIGSSPYGKSYGQYTGEIWQHFQQIPLDTNPANDETGAFCDIGQDDPNVWFLVGTFGGKQVRECEVPADRGFAILLAGVSCSYAEDPSLRNEDDLRTCAEENVGDMRLRASINGVEIQDLAAYYSVSPVFPVTLPEGNVWDVQGPADTEFVAAGWTLIVAPLPPGKHVIEFSAEERNFAATGEPVWSTETVYNITVTEL